jgi:TolA-binding protein
MNSGRIKCHLVSTSFTGTNHLTNGQKHLPARATLSAATACGATCLASVIGILSAASAQTTATFNSPNSADAGFGSAVPNERFVHEFQHQVIQQLQSTLDQASRDQEERLRRFEEQQNQKLREQSEGIQRTLNEMQNRQSDYSDVRDAPRVNVRHFRDDPSSDTPSSSPDLKGTAPPLDLLTRRGTPNSKHPKHEPSQSANLSPHGFVDGRLLNGVVAIVGGSERESVVALTGSYQAANGFLTDLNGCLALVQGRPELPAGRIDFKVSRLTCNFPDGASKTWDVSGWLVDTDGIRGLRARIVENVGRKALVASAGGALGGVGRRLSQQQYQISAGPLTSTSSFIGSATHDAIGGSAEGAASALEQSIADYYNLYAPSLQVGGGTPTSVVIANELKFPPSGVSSTQTHASVP